MMARKVPSTNSAGEVFYAPHPHLRTKTAQREAQRLAKIAKFGLTDNEFDEDAFFRAMHTAAYWSSPKRTNISASTRRRWFRRWQTLREAIVQANLGLVFMMIPRFRSKDVDEDELNSEAMLSMARAVDRFNPWRGYRFSTYACNCIARACMRRGRGEHQHRQRFPVYYDATLDTPSELPDFEVDLRVERLRNALQDSDNELTDLEEHVLRSRFPQDDSDRQTFKEIARTVGLSKERVRQIQNTALDKLRDYLQNDPMLQ